MPKGFLNTAFRRKAHNAGKRTEIMRSEELFSRSDGKDGVLRLCGPRSNGLLAFNAHTGNRTVCQMSLADSFPRGEKKYELVPDQQVIVAGTTLYRIRALKNFGDVKAGDLGGCVRSENNLSQRGDCWIGDDAQVYDEAVVSDDAQIFGRGRVYGHARVRDKGQVLGNAQIFGNGRVFKNGVVFDNAKVFGAAQVRDNGLVYGDAEIFDNVRVVERGQVCGDAWLGGRTVIDGRENGSGFASDAPRQRPGAGG